MEKIQLLTQLNHPSQTFPFNYSHIIGATLISVKHIDKLDEMSCYYIHEYSWFNETYWLPLENAELCHIPLWHPVGPKNKTKSKVILTWIWNLYSLPTVTSKLDFSFRKIHSLWYSKLPLDETHNGNQIFNSLFMKLAKYLMYWVNGICYQWFFFKFS